MRLLPSAVPALACCAALAFPAQARADAHDRDAAEGEGEGEGEGGGEGEGEGEGEGGGEGEGEGDPGEGEGEGECPDVAVGGPCDSDADCGEGGECLDFLATGYCIVDAEASCCPQGSEAVEFEEGGAACLASCESDEDCRAGAEAWQQCDEGICWGCEVPDAVPVGAPCTADADCGEGGACLEEEAGEVFPGGYCAIDWIFLCCPAGTSDVQLDEEGESMWCLKSCASDADCREAEGYLCDNDLDLCLPLAGAGEGEGEGEGAPVGGGEGEPPGAGEGEGDGTAEGEGEPPAAAAKDDDDGFCASAPGAGSTAPRGWRAWLTRR